MSLPSQGSCGAVPTSPSMKHELLTWSRESQLMAPTLSCPQSSLQRPAAPLPSCPLPPPKPCTAGSFPCFRAQPTSVPPCPRSQHMALLPLGPTTCQFGPACLLTVPPLECPGCKDGDLVRCSQLDPPAGTPGRCVNKCLWNDQMLESVKEQMGSGPNAHFAAWEARAEMR